MVGLGLSIKLKHDIQYFIIEVDPLFKFKNEWKHGGVTS